MTELLADTDVFVDHLRGTRRLDEQSLAYSVITRCELFAGRGSQEPQILALLAPLRELQVDRAIAERAGRLRRNAGIHTPDALIAATALEHELSLLTRNRRHFSRVEGLRLVDRA